MPPLWWAALVAGLAYLGVVASGAKGPVRAIKPAPALLLAGLLAPTHPLGAAGMLLSAAGDAFLLDKDRFLLHGLASFLVGHLLFVPAFLAASGDTPSPIRIVVLLAFALALVAYLRPRKSVLKLAVPVYAVVLCGMVAAASTLGPVGEAGGLLFLVSDAVLAVRLFKRDFRGGDLVVMITYYAALLALAGALVGTIGG